MNAPTLLKRRKLSYYGHKDELFGEGLDRRMHTRIQNKGSSTKMLERRYQRMNGAYQCGSKIARSTEDGEQGKDVMHRPQPSIGG